MSDTTFVTGTVIPVAWLNDINDVVYTVLAAGGSVPATAAALRANIGSLSVGDAVFVATSAAVARAALGSTTVGDAVFIAASTAAARTALAAAGSGAVTASGLTQTTARLLGRTTAATGAIEEISMGTGIALATTTLALSMSSFTNTLGADVALSNMGNYFIGPTVTQGSTGTWLAVGCVTLADTAGAATMRVKLTDGTNIKASTLLATAGASSNVQCCLVGLFAAPPGNIRIECKDSTSTSGVILFNSSGNSADATLTVARIA